MSEYYRSLTTETVNIETQHIDECDTMGIVSLINRQDQGVAIAVQKVLPQVAQAVDLLYDRLSGHGRMFYVGAGTSGRLGVLDASECPPTFGTSPQMVQAYIAGGDIALRTAAEGCEDDGPAGAALCGQLGIGAEDALVGITASGSAAYVYEALREAKRRGAAVIAVVNNDNTLLHQLCDVTIAPIVGPEAVVGSTRMKSGTSQKLVLNMLTTATMIKLGKVYGNLMVDVRASNKKLLNRAAAIVAQVTGVDDATAQSALERADMSAKLAILMLKTGLEREPAQHLLKTRNGRLADALLEPYSTADSGVPENKIFMED